jgi:hypothetical protein
VLAKAQAAVKWCKAASQHGKPWSYLLITDDRLIGASTFAGLVASCGLQPASAPVNQKETASL